MNKDFVAAKMKDYQISNYSEKLDIMLEKLESIIHGKDFMTQMSRFIPTDVQERTLKKPKFLDALAIEIREMLNALK